MSKADKSGFPSALYISKIGSTNFAVTSIISSMIETAAYPAAESFPNLTRVINEATALVYCCMAEYNEI